MVEQASFIEIGSKIRQERRRLKISTVDMAEAAGISRVTLHRIEHGEGTVALGMYAKALDVLGLAFDVVCRKAVATATGGADEALQDAERIDFVFFEGCPQLKRIGWHIHGINGLPAKDALNLYERNWRHVDQKAMTDHERHVVSKLVKDFGNGRLLI